MLALLGPLPWGLLAATLLLPVLSQTGLACPTKAKHTSLKEENLKEDGKNLKKI